MIISYNQVVLTVVMNTTRSVPSERSNSNINIDKFEVMTPMTIPMMSMMIPMMTMMIMLRQVEFKHTNAKLDVKGLGGKIIQKLSNSVSKFATECLFL